MTDVNGFFFKIPRRAASIRSQPQTTQACAACYKVAVPANFLFFDRFRRSKTSSLRYFHIADISLPSGVWSFSIHRYTARGLYWLRKNPWLRASVGWNTSFLQSVEYNGHLYRKRRWSLYDKYAGIHIIQCLLLLHRLGGINHRLTMFTDDHHTLLLCMMVSLPMVSLM